MSRCRRTRTVPIIVYLHKIQDNRMPGSMMKSLNHLRVISDTGVISNVVLVTTLWSELAEDIGARREQDLQNNYWRDLLARGCKYKRFDNNYKSAWAIINKFNVQDSPQEEFNIPERFERAGEQEQQRRNREEEQKKSFLSKFVGFFRSGNNRSRR